MNFLIYLERIDPRDQYKYEGISRDQLDRVVLGACLEHFDSRESLVCRHFQTSLQVKPANIRRLITINF